MDPHLSTLQSVEGEHEIELGKECLGVDLYC